MGVCRYAGSYPEIRLILANISILERRFVGAVPQSVAVAPGFVGAVPNLWYWRRCKDRTYSCLFLWRLFPFLLSRFPMRI